MYFAAWKKYFASILSDFIQDLRGCSHRHLTVFLKFSKLDPMAYRLLSITRDGLAVRMSIIWLPTVHTVHVTAGTLIRGWTRMTGQQRIDATTKKPGPACR